MPEKRPNRHEDVDVIFSYLLHSMDVISRVIDLNQCAFLAVSSDEKSGYECLVALLGVIGTDLHDIEQSLDVICASVRRIEPLVTPVGEPSASVNQSPTITPFLF